MSIFIEKEWSMYEGTHAMRDELLNSFSDADLAFSPGGLNMTFGALCREMGEIEYSYLQSLKTLTQNFDYRNSEPGLETSVAKLKDWFHKLDDEMKAVLSAKSDEDMKKVV